MALTENDQRIRKFEYGGTTDDLKTTSCWSLRTDDGAAVVETSGYFDALGAKMTKGDQILASLAVGGTPIGKMYIVTEASKDAVAIEAFG